MEPPLLSPLALDGTSGLDGWDVEEDFDIDFEDLFDDAEAIDSSRGTRQYQQKDDQQQHQCYHHQQQQDRPSTGCGDEQSHSSNTSDTVGLLSPSGGAAGELNTYMPDQVEKVSPAIEQEDCPVVPVASTTAAGTSISATTWSTSSASEDSDDCSRSILSASSCTLGGISPSSGPVPSLDSVVESGYGSSSSATEASPSVTSETSVRNSDTMNDNFKRVIPVSSGAGAPILPFAFAPAFGGAGGPSIVNFGGLQAAALAAASGAAGQALSAGWKRLRGGDDVSSSVAATQGQASSSPAGSESAAPTRLLCRGTDDRNAGHGRISKRAKREERLMKNREAANRSRVKRKEVLAELENRVKTLSNSLTASREEAAALSEEVASLREQNSFLRGMLSVQGNMVDLPPILPKSTTTSHIEPCQQRIDRGRGGIDVAGAGAGSGSRGASATIASASAIIGAAGMGMAVISCVALSATGFGVSNNDGRDHEWRMGYENSEVGTALGNANRAGGGGRRTLLAVEVDDYHLDEEVGQPGCTGDAGGPLVTCLAVALAFVLVLAVAHWAYHKAVARQRIIGRGRLGRRRGGALRERQGKCVTRGLLEAVRSLVGVPCGDSSIIKHT